MVTMAFGSLRSSRGTGTVFLMMPYVAAAGQFIIKCGGVKAILFNFNIFLRQYWCKLVVRTIRLDGKVGFPTGFRVGWFDSDECPITSRKWFLKLQITVNCYWDRVLSSIHSFIYSLIEEESIQGWPESVQNLRKLVRFFVPGQWVSS